MLHARPRATRNVVTGEPALPARATVPAQAQHPGGATVTATDPTARGRTSNCAWKSSPAIRARSRATSNTATRCAPTPSAHRPGLRAATSATRTPQNRHAVDFALPNRHAGRRRARRRGDAGRIRFRQGRPEQRNVRRPRQLRPHPARRRQHGACTRTCSPTASRCASASACAAASDRPVGQHRLHQRPAPALRGAGQSRHAAGVDPVPDVRAARDPAFRARRIERARPRTVRLRAVRRRHAERPRPAIIRALPPEPGAPGAPSPCPMLMSPPKPRAAAPSRSFRTPTPARPR